MKATLARLAFAAILPFAAARTAHAAPAAPAADRYPSRARTTRSVATPEWASELYPNPHTQDEFPIDQYMREKRGVCNLERIDNRALVRDKA